MVTAVKNAVPAEVYLDSRGGGVSNEEIAQKLYRKSGKHPLRLEPRDRKRIQAHLVKRMRKLIVQAFRQRRAPDLGRELQAVAAMVVAALKGRIASGKLGRNPAGYARAKAKAVTEGKATGKYGVPPPFGVRSGRFIDSIKARTSQRRVTR